MNKKLVTLSLSFAVTSALFPSAVNAADNRSRNVIITKPSNLTQSSNGTDVINIEKPNSTGISHNKYDQFDIYGNVIINNSLKDGQSQIGGSVNKNPNLNGNAASTIINEINSKNQSQLQGALEVFGNRADLIFANENGINVNGAQFINTNGVTLTTGKVNDRNVNVSSNKKITIGQNGVAIDGDYFNVISRSIELSGAITSKSKDKLLDNVNVIAGTNEVSLKDAKNPVVTKTNTPTDNSIDVAIDGKTLGSMYANKISFVSTDKGVGVKHQGTITSVDDVLFKINGSLDNSGKINSTKDVHLQSQSLNNTGDIKANNNIALNLENKLANQGNIIAQKNIELKATGKDFDLKAGKLYAKENLNVTANNLNVTDKLENEGAININAQGDLNNKSLIASAKNVALEANNINNDGYVFAKDNLNVKAKDTVNNNGTLESNSNVNIDATTVNNKAFVQAYKDININAKELNNLASLSGDISAGQEQSSAGSGWANYGDTAFKRWKMQTTITNIPVYDNKLVLKTGVIQAHGDVNINTKSQDKNSNVTNQGKIIAGNNANIIGNVKNQTLSKELSIIDILKSIKFDGGFIAKEYLGSWNTNGTSYFTKGGSLYDALVYFADGGAKNHQRESAWNAIKDAASKNESLNQYLSLLFGSDYAKYQFVPTQSQWHSDAALVFTPANGASIVAGKDANLVANDFSQGLDHSLDKNFTTITGDIKNGVISDSWIKDQISNIINSGIFDITVNPDNNQNASDNNHQDTGSDNIADNSQNNNQGSVDNNGSSVDNSTESKDDTIANNDSSNSSDNGNIHYEYHNSSSIFSDPQAQYDFAYLLEKLNGNKNINYNLIGDKDFEYKLLSGMYAQLSNGQSLSADSVKQFLDNAAELQNSLNLQLGKELSADQIAKLDKDVIWYVNTNVNGHEVLTPVLYLATNKAPTEGVIANNNVNINANNINNTLGNINGKNNVNLVGDDVHLTGANVNGQNVNINADNVNIDSINSINNKGQQEFIGSNVNGSDNVNITAKDDVTINGSTVSAKNNVSISGDNITLSADKQTNGSFSQNYQDTTMGNQSFEINQSLNQANVSGANVNLNAQKDVNIKGSNVTGTSENGQININANNVTIENEYLNTQKEQSGLFNGMNQAGLYEYSTSNVSQELSTAKGSNISGKGNVNINAKNDVNVVGSDIQGNDIKLEGNNVNIKDATDTNSAKSDKYNYQVLGYAVSKSTLDETKSHGSNIKANNNLTINANKDVVVQGSNLAAGNNANINAQNTTFIAGKNTSKSSDQTHGFGIFSNAQAEIAGQGYSVAYRAIDGTTSHGQSTSSITQDGLRNDLVGFGEVGFEIAGHKSDKQSTTYTNSSISAGNININNSQKLDIGGVDLKADKDINAKASEVVSTKYVNTSKEDNLSYGIFIKQRLETTSAIVGAINQAVQNSTANANGLPSNGGIVAAQVVSNGLTIASSDLFSETSLQTAGIKYTQDTKSTTSENINNIKAGGNINITSTGSDITLNGVKLDGKNVNLDSAGDVNINAAHSTSSSKGGSFDAMISLTQTGGVHAEEGARGNAGVAFYGNMKYKQADESTYTNSSINAANNISIKSKGDANIIGSNVTGANVNLDIGKDLNVKSVSDTKDAYTGGFTANGNIALGLSSNEVISKSVNLGGGIEYSKSNSSVINKQASIEATNSISGNVGNNLNLTAGVIDGKNGNINVSGEVTSTKVSGYEKSDGANVNAGLGTEKKVQALIDIHDHIAKDTVTDSAINVNINGNKNHGVNTDVNNTQSTTDTSWAGGTINLNSTIAKTKELINKVYDSATKNNSSAGSQAGSSSNANSSSGSTQLPSIHINDQTYDTRL